MAESKRLDPDAIDIARSSGEKWVYVGSKRTHTHDVRALAIATPIVAPVTPAGTLCYIFPILLLFLKMADECYIRSHHFRNMHFNGFFVISFNSFYFR